jgi:predicted nuclease of predicted toxin-antitoxin system
MWLLDANLDIHLLGVLSELGIPCDAAIRRDWADLSNGELVLAAREAGFTCLVTRDRMFAESASRSLQTKPLTIVVVHIPQKPWREFIREFRGAWARQPIDLTPESGAITHWPTQQE